MRVHCLDLEGLIAREAELPLRASFFASSGFARLWQLLGGRVRYWIVQEQGSIAAVLPAHSNRFHLTHEFLAYMLGVRRVGITEAAGSLQARGLIRYSRGEILVRDPAALERIACPCYRQAKDMYEQMLGARPDAAPSVDRAQC
jgi:hypothetical protein